MASAIGMRRLAAATVILLLSATLQVVSLGTYPAAAASVTPDVVEGNPTCADFDADGAMLKIEGGDELRGADSGTYTAGDLTVTVEIYSTDMGWAFDWTSDQPIDVVVAKGGPVANVYAYGGATADNGLHAPLNVSSEMWYGLSHISFCSGDTTSTTGDTTPTTRKTTPTTPKTSVTTDAELGAIGDYVWLDLDGDGRQGPPELEEPVVGATVHLLAADGTLLASQVTGIGGLYLFDELPAGNYRVQVVYEGATYTIPRAPGVSPAANSDVDPLGNGVGMTALITLSEGEVDLTWDAGIIVEVLGIQIEAPSTSAPVEPVTVDTLPFTGSQAAGLLAMASMLLLGGVVALLAARQHPSGKAPEAPIGSWANH